MTTVDAPTTLRSALVAALNNHRDNDVRVHVPLESGGYVRLNITGVSYDPTSDVIRVDTEQHYDLPYDPGVSQ